MENTGNKFALITGATGGIGYELANLFAKDKYNLIIVARHEDELNKTVAELSSQFGIRVIPLAKDLFNPEAAFEVYNEVKAQGIDVEVLVNDAGQGQYGFFSDTDIRRELDIVQLNISSLLVLTKMFLKDMLSRRSGKILQVASIAGKLPGPLQSVYHATKAFVLSHTESLVNELKDTGVTITALMPGATETDFFNKADAENTKMVQEGSLSDPVDVAKDGYEALMSGESRIISGLKNKAMVGMSSVMPDNLVAEQMRKQMEQSEKGE